MAMEKLYVVRDTHTRSITALGYNPARREILMGCEGILNSALVSKREKERICLYTAAPQAYSFTLFLLFILSSYSCLPFCLFFVLSLYNIQRDGQVWPDQNIA